MRITGGRWASRRIVGPPRGVEVRPTPDALREQAFAVLAPRLNGAVFLDLFAGTGAISFEALSRGAARSIALEAAGACVELIRRNAAALGVAEDRLRVVKGDARRTVARLGAEGLVCDLAWCDPPFPAWDHGLAVLAAARSAGILQAGAVVVVEVPQRRTVDLDGFEPVRALRGAVLVAVA